MINRFYIFCIVFLILCITAQINAQEKDKDSLVKLKSGLTLVFRSETDPPSGIKQQDIGTYQVAGENNVVHRAFLDAERGVYFGYDVEIQALNDSNQFRLTFKPLSSISYISISKTVTTNSVGKQPQTTSRSVVLSPMNLSKYPEPQTIRDRDTIAFDVLFNPHTGVKIVDFIKLSVSEVKSAKTSKNEKAGTNKRDEFGQDKNQAALQGSGSSDFGENRSADFTIQAVELNLTSAYLAINGEKFGKENKLHGINLNGPLLWFYLPGRGRFIMSLSPHAGYKFQKLGTISGNKIAFVFAGDKYEWVSTSPVLTTGNRSWNLWVLADPHYRPENSGKAGFTYQFGSSDNIKSFFREK